MEPAIKRIILIALVLFAFNLRAANTSALTLIQTIPLQNVEGRIDHMAVDVIGQRLFIAALGNDTVEVVDLKAGKAVKSLSGFAEPQGMIFVPEFDRLFVANGSDGTCRILDGNSFKLVRTVKLGDDADNIRYDETAKKVYVGYGSGALAAIDARTGERTTDIKLAGHPESFRISTSGAIFVNVPEAGQIALVDRNKGKVTDTWPLEDAAGNFPMFLDEANQRMFVGCRRPAALLIYDSTTGKLAASVPISHDTDDLFYDRDNKLVYVSCGAGVIEVIKQMDANHYLRAETLKTASGARTSLFVPELKILCLAVPHRIGQAAEIRVFKTQ